MVKHKREQKEFAFGEANGYSVCCTAFYAGECVAERSTLPYSMLASFKVCTADCPHVAASMLSLAAFTSSTMHADMSHLFYECTVSISTHTLCNLCC